jgi:hypothetical protein
MHKTLLFAAALMAIPADASAQTFELTIKNGFVEALTGFSVRGGEVEGFRPILPSATRVVSITVPDGACEVRMSVVFADSQSLDVGAFDLCENDLLELTF